MNRGLLLWGFGLCLGGACGEDFAFAPGASDAGGDGGSGAEAGMDAGVGGASGGGGEAAGGGGASSAEGGGGAPSCLPADHDDGCAPVYLSDFCPDYESNVHACLQFDKVYWQSDIDIGGTVYDKGLGMHAPEVGDEEGIDCDYHSDVPYEDGVAVSAWQLGGNFEAFTAMVGIARVGDTPVAETASVTFEVRGDGEVLAVLDANGDEPAVPIEVDVAGVGQLVLAVDGKGDNGSDGAAWAAAQLIPCDGGAGGGAASCGEADVPPGGSCPAACASCDDALGGPTCHLNPPPGGTADCPADFNCMVGPTAAVVSCPENEQCVVDMGGTAVPYVTVNCGAFGPCEVSGGTLAATVNCGANSCVATCGDPSNVTMVCGVSCDCQDSCTL